MTTVLCMRKSQEQMQNLLNHLLSLPGPQIGQRAFPRTDGELLPVHTNDAFMGEKKTHSVTFPFFGVSTPDCSTVDEHICKTFQL